MYSAVPCVAHRTNFSLISSDASPIPSSLCESFNDKKASPFVGNELEEAI